MTYSNDLKLKIFECIKYKKYNNSEIMKIFNISKKTFYKIKNTYDPPLISTRKIKVRNSIKKYSTFQKKVDFLNILIFKNIY